MPLVPMKEILQDALRGGYAVGYFESWDQYSLEAVIEAAENRHSPVIVGFGGIMMDQGWFDGGGLERLGALGRVAAEQSKVPTAFILNEVQTFDQVQRGLKSGFNVVMLDASHLPFEENVRLTRQVVETAHAVGAEAEGELGMLPEAESEHREGYEEGAPSLTDPQKAAEFVDRTGVDALSVSVGNVHILVDGKAEIDLDLLARIHQAVSVPLVIHGGTGFPDEAVPRAIQLGAVKFNVGTVFKLAFLEGVSEAINHLSPQANPQLVVGSRVQEDILRRGKERVREEVERLIDLYRGQA